jgi:3-hydroxyisobutyrate dehydrogenase
MTQMNIGVIGIGAFGSRVALRLLWSGFHTLQIYDIADVAVRMFTNDYGGMGAGSPKMMAQTCDVIIAVLPSAAELREVCFGWEGLAHGFAQRGILIDLGNTDPVETVSIGNALAAAGVDLVAAPAFGTPAQAKEGKLTVVAGGPEAAVERCRPVLDTIATRVLRADAAAAAQAATAIADYLRAARLLAASEAIRLGQRFGFAPATVLDLGRQLGGDLDGVLQQEVVSRRFDSGVQLGLVRRNLDLVARLAEATDTRSPLIDATLAAWTGAERILGYGADHTAVIRWLETLPSLKPAPEPEPEPETAAGEPSPTAS